MTAKRKRRTTISSPTIQKATSAFEWLAWTEFELPASPAYSNLRSGIPAGTMERYRAQEWLNFIATEIHKSFGPLFGSDEAAKEAPRARLGKRFDLVAKTLAAQPYLLGDTFTVADAYLYNMLRWTAHGGIDLAKWPALQAFFARVDARPAVQAALAAEKG